MSKRMLACFAFLVLLAPFAASAAETIESDRMSRCANNRAAIETLENALQRDHDYMTDDQIARARTVMTAFRALNIERYNIDVDRNHSPEMKMRARAELFRKRDALIGSFGIDDLNWVTADNIIAELIDKAVAAGPHHRQMQAELAEHRGRMQELNCSSSPSSSMPQRGADEASNPTRTDGSSTEPCSSVPGTWTWAYAPPGQIPEAHGAVTIDRNGAQSWSVDGRRGTWVCSGSTVTLTWPGYPFVDTLTLSADRQTMEGGNNQGTSIKATH